jgi:hypothetical protein
MGRGREKRGNMSFEFLGHQRAKGGVSLRLRCQSCGAETLYPIRDADATATADRIVRCGCGAQSVVASGSVSSAPESGRPEPTDSWRRRHLLKPD